MEDREEEAARFRLLDSDMKIPWVAVQLMLTEVLQIILPVFQIPGAER